MGETYSTSTLQDYAETLEKLAPRAEIVTSTLMGALEIVEERIDEVAQEVTTSRSPIVSGPKAIDEIFDDAALVSLFRSLAD